MDVLTNTKSQPPLSVQESIFNMVVFPIKEYSHHNSEKIFHNLLPTSVKQVRQLTIDTELTRWVKYQSLIYLVDTGFWKPSELDGLNDKIGCYGVLGLCPCQNCTHTPCKPVDNKRIVLRITASLPYKFDIPIDFSVTVGPRNNSLTPITCVKQEVDVYKTVRYAAVPNAEAYRCLEIVKKNRLDVTISNVCYLSGLDRHDKRDSSIFNPYFTDFIDVTSSAVPVNVLETFEESVAATAYNMKFEMLVIDLERNLDKIKEFFTLLSKRRA